MWMGVQKGQLDVRGGAVGRWRVEFGVVLPKLGSVRFGPLLGQTQTPKSVRIEKFLKPEPNRAVWFHFGLGWPKPKLNPVLTKNSPR